MERRVNDVGGQVDGALHLDEHAVTLHEKRIDALVMLLTSPKVDAFKVDALRRAIEQNTIEDYRKFGYYDKWIRAIRDLLVEQNILTHDEIETRIAAIRARQRSAA
ncbi:SH3-like domain-containing protein [Ferrovibrio sp.]|uniref:SH3-like domain-containing protein n=1 Tax=Ferrovibrio sp. TaxID=1917215 RepID=UPI001B60AABD|nr:SH3-like domain-containing protein [Ferrovibrio sp.]MBP7065732.1 nitrile hydratase subunit beta [Ferrovibrio sp.]